MYVVEDLTDLVELVAYSLLMWWKTLKTWWNLWHTVCGCGGGPYRLGGTCGIQFVDVMEDLTDLVELVAYSLLMWWRTLQTWWNLWRTIC